MRNAIWIGPILMSLLVGCVSATLTPTPTPTPAATPTPKISEVIVVLGAEEQAFLTLINEYRADNGVGALSLDPELTNVADWMSSDMAAKDYLSHTDSLGRDPFQRMVAFGYDYNTWKGENLAGGAETAQAVLDAFKSSQRHDAIMLNPNYKVIGIARVFGEGTTHGWYWSTEFGGQ